METSESILPPLAKKTPPALPPKSKKTLEIARLFQRFRERGHQKVTPSIDGGGSGVVGDVP